MELDMKKYSRLNSATMSFLKQITAALMLIAVIMGHGGCAPEDDASIDAKEFVFAGTFDGDGSEGLYVFEFDRKNVRLQLIQTIFDRLSPTFQAVHPDLPVLYSASRHQVTGDSDHHTIGAYRIDQTTGMLSLINEQSVLGLGPAHVSVDPLGSFVFVSNYTTGNVAMLPVRDDGSLDEASDLVQHDGSSVHPTRQQRAHAHAADPSPDGRFLYVSDLGMDRIMIYEIDRQQRALVPASQPWFSSTPGAGPRHLTFRPDGAFAYLAEELTSTVAVLRVDGETGALEQIQGISMLPEDFGGSNTAADIHVSPDGRYLYASNRGHDSIVQYSIDESTGELSLAGHESTVGEHPRNFMMDVTGELVFVANRDSNHIVIFRRDAKTGALEFTGVEVEVPRAVCVSQIVF